ncbi:MAG: hypothetical protein KAS98_08195, partial [Deltaproteobacteria bacterium]|nr:hypothetical protein [Deltaproteobacteria bacterium]
RNKINYYICLFGKLQLDYHPDEIINNTGFPLDFIPYLIRGGNDKFFQSVPPLSVIPAKAGIQEQIDNLSIGR